MVEAFKNFVDQIPSEIMAKTESHSDANMIIFRPTSFIINEETYLEDYHFVLPSSDPPPLRIEHRVHHFAKGKLISVVPETRLSCTEPALTRPYIAMMVKKGFFQEIPESPVEKRKYHFREGITLTVLLVLIK